MTEMAVVRTGLSSSARSTASRSSGWRFDFAMIGVKVSKANCLVQLATNLSACAAVSRRGSILQMQARAWL